MTSSHCAQILSELSDERAVQMASGGQPEPNTPGGTDGALEWDEFVAFAKKYVSPPPRHTALNRAPPHPGTPPSSLARPEQSHPRASFAQGKPPPSHHHHRASFAHTSAAEAAAADNDAPIAVSRFACR